MAGHSQFKNIMHRKGAQDKKRAKIFTKLIREITVSAKMNPDPEANPRLRAAIAAARAANMPKDNVERAIHKASSTDEGDNYEEVRYEGYGPSGVAVIVEALTDNRNRTASEVRSLFSKHGGSLGESNSVSFQFQHLGYIAFNELSLDLETFMEKALEAGADDITEEPGVYEAFCEMETLHAVAEALSKAVGQEADTIELIWKPQTLIDVPSDKLDSVETLVSVLEDNDDVQKVFTNCHWPERPEEE